MSFISYMSNLYLNKITLYEDSFPLQNEQLYEAKQYLKFIDDIVDEGYTYLRNQLEENFSGYTRLFDVVYKNNSVPFPILKTENISSCVYGIQEYELNEYLDNLTKIARDTEPTLNHPFLNEMVSYSEYIKNLNAPDTAFIFLLRDTLIPYLSFIKDNRCQNTKAYPLLIGRHFLQLITKQEDLDDDIRAVIIDALEQKISTYTELKEYVRPRFLSFINKYPLIKDILSKQLHDIEAKKIIIVESGIFATFPLLLTALDDRIEIQLYTAIPFLYPIYKDFCFTNAYEKNRSFETVVCQETLFKLCTVKNGKFYIHEAESPLIKKAALGEISYLYKQMTVCNEIH